MSLLVSNITSIISSSTPLPNLIAIFGSSTKEESLIVVASMEHPFPQSRLFDYFTQPRFARFLSPPLPRGIGERVVLHHGPRLTRLKCRSLGAGILLENGASLYVRRIPRWGREGGEQELIRNGRTTVNYSYPGQNPLPPSRGSLVVASNGLHAT